jgi:hypothetical protein
VQPRPTANGRNSSSKSDPDTASHPGIQLTKKPSCSCQTRASDLDATITKMLLSEITIPLLPRPSCAEYFTILESTKWDNSCIIYQAKPPKQGPGVNVKKSQLDIILDMASKPFQDSQARSIYNYLHQRQFLIRQYQTQLLDAEDKIASGVSRNQAIRLAAAHLVTIFAMVPMRDNDNVSGAEFTHYMFRKIREGQRWQEMIDAIGAREILLINDNDDEDDTYHNPDNDGSGNHYDASSKEEDEMMDINRFERCCFKNKKTLNVAKIMKRGTDSVFAKLKDTLLAPELMVKDTCQRLSGLVHMINRVQEADPGSELATYLTSEIQRRVEEVFGEPKSKKSRAVNDGNGERASGILENTNISRVEGDLTGVTGDGEEVVSGEHERNNSPNERVNDAEKTARQIANDYMHHEKVKDRESRVEENNTDGVIGGDATCLDQGFDGVYWSDFLTNDGLQGLQIV